MILIITNRASRSVLLLTVAVICASTYPTPVVAQGRTLKVARLVRTFGGHAADDERFVISSIQSVQSGPNGLIYVLDRRESDIKVFEANGTYVRRIGRSGTGPGEFSNGSVAMKVKAKEIVVTDLMLRRDVVFSLDGKHIRTTNHPQRSDRSAPTTSFQMQGGWLLSVSPPNIVDDRIDVYWRLTARGPGGKSDTVGAIRSNMVEVAISSEGGRTTYSFQETGVAHGGAYAIYEDSLLAIVDGYSGEAQYFGFGKAGVTKLRAAAFGSPARAAPPRLADSVREILQARWQKLRPGSTVTVRNAPSRSSIASSALFADDGSLWIGAPADASGSRWTVLASDGSTFTILLPKGFVLSSVRGNLAYGYGTSAEDIPEVRVFEVSK